MKFLIFLMVISIVLLTADSLRCYDCLKCDDSYKDDKNLVECEKGACTRTVLTLTNKTSIVSRGCAKNSAGPNISPIILPYNNLTEFHSVSAIFCGTDSCNGAGSFTAVFSIIFTTLIALIFANEST